VNKLDKFVLCVPNAYIVEKQISGLFNSPHMGEQLKKLLQHSVFLCRGWMETETRFRQLIPYCVIRSPEGFLVYQRKTGDDRLLSKHSLGIGGHIDIEKYSDYKFDKSSIFNTSLERELREEMGDKIDEVGFVVSEPKWFISLGDTEVDSVHLGIVFCVDISKPIKPVGDEIGWHEYKSIDEIDAMSRDDNIEFEKWSEVLIEHLFSM